MSFCMTNVYRECREKGKKIEEKVRLVIPQLKKFKNEMCLFFSRFYLLKKKAPVEV